MPTSPEQFDAVAARYKKLMKEALAVGKKGLAAEYKTNMEYAQQRAELARKQQGQDSNDIFTVDLEYRNGTRRHPQFVTRQEAVAYAGRMAQDSRIAHAEVQGLDSVEDLNKALSHPDPNWGYFRVLSPADKQLMDKLLVEKKHPLAMEPGTNENRFKKLHASGYRF